MSQATGERSARLNMRVTPDALATIREAAAAQQQDVSAFVLGAALDKARWTLMETRVLHLSPAEWELVDRLLDEEPQPAPRLAELLRWAREHEIPELSTPDRPVHRLPSRRFRRPSAE